MDAMPLKLFYSYSHQDSTQRKELEKHLSVLVKNGLITQWYDGHISAGSFFESKIVKSLEEADIVLFLVTANWLDSQACTEEWKYAKELASSQPNKRLISVIGSDCAWLDFDDMRKYLVLPQDGKPVTQWKPQSAAWSNVYDGLKFSIDEIKKNFLIQPEFKSELNSIEFCSASASDVTLNDIFVFPNIVSYTDNSDDIEELIETYEQLTHSNYLLIHGDSQSGKTKLGEWLYLQLHNNQSPCILIDFEQVGSGKNKLKILQEQFIKQQTGDFGIWFSQENKQVIFDNISKDRKCTELIEFAKEHFSNILILSNSDTYKSYYVDDGRLIDYKVATIKPLCHGKQEDLIKNWIKAKSRDGSVDHNLIDSIENNINSIVIDNKVLPRYPFFILSILQTYESFMPENFKITAYGHCYHALILARLIKAGIDKDDSALESAFTFCSHLAYHIFEDGNNSHINETDFNEFYNKYSDEYLIKQSVLSRLFSEYGILENNDGKVKFGIAYSHYYFLGKYLTENYSDNKDVVSSMVESSFARHNSLTLIFTIHHANDISIIDEILAHTICAIDDKTPARLEKSDTDIFKGLLENILPEKISDNSNIEEERKRERKVRTDLENKKNSVISAQEKVEDLAAQDNLLNQVFKCNKNMEILSQILKNKTGSLKKAKLTEIVEIICDAGLRMASIMLDDQEEIDIYASYVYEQYKKSDEFDSSKSDSFHLANFRKMIVFKIMLWVLSSIEKTVAAINKPELSDIISDLVNRKSTPAYHLIKYFYMLDTSKSFDNSLKTELEFMVSEYSKEHSFFLNRIVSLRTLHYERTHRVKETHRQAIFSLLKIAYQRPALQNSKLLED